MEFLAGFLTRWREERARDGFSVTPRGSEEGPRRTPEPPQVCVLHLFSRNRRRTLCPEPSCVCVQAAVDWRGAVVRELHHSERVYVARLSAVLKVRLPVQPPCSVLRRPLTLLPVPVSQVYQEPLAAALSSNRAILSFTDVQLILSPVAHLLELNRCAPARLLLCVCVCFVTF